MLFRSNIAMNLNVSSNKNKIFLKIPRADIGKASLENIHGLFEKKTGKTDIYLSGKDSSGGFSIDGTWTHPSKSGSSGKNKGYLELHGTIDSISIENIYNGAVSVTELTVPMQKLLETSISPVQMTSEFYISSDFEHFSYNIIQAVLASKSKNGFYSLFSLQGNESSLNKIGRAHV